MRQIFSSIAAGIKAAFAALGRGALVFCKETGRFVYKYIAEPVWDGVCIGTSFMARELGRLPGDLVSTVVRTPVVALGLVNKTVGAVGDAVGGLGRALAGGSSGGGRIEGPPPMSPEVSQAIAAMRDRQPVGTVKRKPKAAPRTLTEADHFADAFVEDVAEKCWEYAAADDKKSVDLMGVPPGVVAWLVTRSAGELAAICSKSVDEIAELAYAGAAKIDAGRRARDSRPAASDIPAPVLPADFDERVDRALGMKVTELTADRDALAARIQRMRRNERTADHAYA